MSKIDFKEQECVNLMESFMENNDSFTLAAFLKKAIELGLIYIIPESPPQMKRVGKNHGTEI